eukprot:979136_1
MSEKGIMFIESGSLYVVTSGITAIRVADMKEVDIEDIIINNIKGKINLAIPFDNNIKFLQLKSEFFFKKYNNKCKQTKNMTGDIVLMIREELQSSLKTAAGFKRDLYVTKVRKSGFKNVKQSLYEQIGLPKTWKTHAVSEKSQILNEHQLKKLIKNYPLQIGKEQLSLQGAVIYRIHKANHIRENHLRVEIHVISTNIESQRIIGDLQEKKKKESVKRKAKLLAKKKSKFKVGQIYKQPSKKNPSRVFYQSLYVEDQDSLMAISYLLYYGVFHKDYAQG